MLLFLPLYFTPEAFETVLDIYFSHGLDFCFIFVNLDSLVYWHITQAHPFKCCSAFWLIIWMLGEDTHFIILSHHRLIAVCCLIVPMQLFKFWPIDFPILEWVVSASLPTSLCLIQASKKKLLLPNCWRTVIHKINIFFPRIMEWFEGKSQIPGNFTLWRHCAVMKSIIWNFRLTGVQDMREPHWAAESESVLLQNDSYQWVNKNYYPLRQ